MLLGSFIQIIQKYCWAAGQPSDPASETLFIQAFISLCQIVPGLMLPCSQTLCITVINSKAICFNDFTYTDLPIFAGCEWSADGDGRLPKPPCSGPCWGSLSQLQRGLSKSHPRALPRPHHRQARPGATEQVQRGKFIAVLNVFLFNRKGLGVA